MSVAQQTSTEHLRQLADLGGLHRSHRAELHRAAAEIESLRKTNEKLKAELARLLPIVNAALDGML